MGAPKRSLNLSAKTEFSAFSLLHLPSGEEDFLPRCVECRRGLAMRILSARLSNACTVTKRKKDLSRFLLQYLHETID